MKCHRCGIDSPAENNYCGHCGAALREPDIGLKEIVAAGILKPGAPLSCRRRGEEVLANLTAEGEVEWEGQVYATPLSAIEAIRGGATCDGWYCWQTTHPTTGRQYPISHFRGEYRRVKGSA